MSRISYALCDSRFAMLSFMPQIVLPRPTRLLAYSRSPTRPLQEIHCPTAFPVRLRLPPCASNTPTSSSSSSASTQIPELKLQLQSALSGLNRGLAIDADADTLSDEEALVEDIIEMLEQLDDTLVPTRDPRMYGAWELIYTSSSITRYFGGATGLQKLLPNGNVTSIEQYIDAEDGSCQFRERIRFDIPLVGKEVQGTAVANGMLRVTGERRQVWEPIDVKFYFFRQMADSWKTLRAFQVADTTFLDDDIRITRGQTGSVNVFRKLYNQQEMH